MDDLISREAAIDALNEMKIYKPLDSDRWVISDCLNKIVNLPSAQPERIQNNAVHLCDSCQYTYVTCPSHGNDAVFGDGKGNDNICACNKYRPISAQPEQRWIPCSERLPEEGVEVLCCFRNGDNYKIIVSKRTDFNYWSSVGRTGDAIAWMPLPEPYRAERKEDEK